MAEIDREELKNSLLDYFTDGAPNYKIANEYQQARSRLIVNDVLPLIDSYAAEKEKAARIKAKRKYKIQGLDFAEKFIIGQFKKSRQKNMVQRLFADARLSVLQESEVKVPEVVWPPEFKLQNEREGKRES